MGQQTGKWIILVGVVLVCVGLLIHFAGDKLRWLGRLPGDIRIEREGFSFYFPITTMIVISVLLNVIWRLVRGFL